MKKNLGKKIVSDAGTLVAYACSCPCISPGCSCENPMNTLAETRYAMSVGTFNFWLNGSNFLGN